MNENKLIKKIAHLESLNDLLISELQYLDQISRKLGFHEGLKTLKAAAQEMLQEQEKEQYKKDDDQMHPEE